MTSERNTQPQEHNLKTKDYWLYTFAGQAMQGVLAGCPDLSAKSQIEYAVMQAHALLAELEKEAT